jgi:hypothetical protein
MWPNVADLHRVELLTTLWAFRLGMERRGVAYLVARGFRVVGGLGACTRLQRVLQLLPHAREQLRAAVRVVRLHQRGELVQRKLQFETIGTIRPLKV